MSEKSQNKVVTLTLGHPVERGEDKGKFTQKIDDNTA